eukprot:gene13859-4058_t
MGEQWVILPSAKDQLVELRKFLSSDVLDVYGFIRNETRYVVLLAAPVGDYGEDLSALLPFPIHRLSRAVDAEQISQWEQEQFELGSHLVKVD